jgi:ElaB/YqjD/DUF883 family membrane-anchored ribosome-binding protein
MQTNIKKVDAIDVETKPTGISAEFQHFLADIEDLVAQATSLTGDDLSRAKNTLNNRISAAKHSLEDMSGNLVQKARDGAAVTNNYVHEQPWAAIGVSAAVGVLVGFLLSRRS